MNSAPQIRPARLEDAAQIARLSNELGYEASEQQTHERLVRQLQLPAHNVLVAAGAGQTLLGWASVEIRLMLESGDKAELTGLVVSASARKLGVGRALVAAAERWAAQQGMRCICVRSNIARAESHPFYRAIGYAPKKTQHVYEKPLPRP